MNCTGWSWLVVLLSNARGDEVLEMALAEGPERKAVEVEEEVVAATVMALVMGGSGGGGSRAVQTNSGTAGSRMYLYKIIHKST